MAADLARSRPRTHRNKRPYQPTLAAYFRPSTFPLYLHPGSLRALPTDSHDSRHKSGLVPLEESVQASLLNVGMRVRKAVSGGYQRQEKEYGGAGKRVAEGQIQGAVEDKMAGQENAGSVVGELGVWDSLSTLGRKRPLFDIDEQEEEDSTTDTASEMNTTEAPAAALTSMSGRLERRIARPTARLKNVQAPNATAGVVSAVGMDVDVDFGEADFLRPLSEANFEVCEAEMDVG